MANGQTASYSGLSGLEPQSAQYYAQLAAQNPQLYAQAAQQLGMSPTQLYSLLAATSNSPMSTIGQTPTGTPGSLSALYGGGAQGNILSQLLGTSTGSAGGGAAAPAQATAAQPLSYLGTAPTINLGTATGTAGGSSMATQPAQQDWNLWNQAAAKYGFSSPEIAEWIKAGYGASDIANSYAQTGQPPQGPTPAQQQAAATPAAASGANQPQPETVALQQMGQIDPATEQLRQSLASSYLTPLTQAQTPTAAQFQSNLSLYNQLDPTTAAARTQLGSALAAQSALGTQLDPATQRQIEQQTRIAQSARGNVYGTPQLVEEAMTTGQAGLALQQQRQSALQSYLQSGQSTGDVAMNLYNQQQARVQAAQQSALGYLGSGQTPYQAGAAYVNQANQNAATAAQGGPSYQPSAQSPYYTGAGTSSYPQYGLDMSQLGGNWYNNINAANLQAYGLTPQGGGQGGQLMKAGAGALSGAATGALGGAAVGGVGAIPGAIIGGIAGGASSYFG